MKANIFCESMRGFKMSEKLHVINNGNYGFLNSLNNNNDPRSSTIKYLYTLCIFFLNATICHKMLTRSDKG